MRHFRTVLVVATFVIQAVVLFRTSFATAFALRTASTPPPSTASRSFFFLVIIAFGDRLIWIGEFSV